MNKRLVIPMMALAMLLLPGAAIAQPTTAAPDCPAVDLHQGTQADPACDSLPGFKASFLNRVWSFDGSVDQVDLEAHTLDMTTTAIENLPARFANQDDALLDQDTHVAFKDSTRVYGPEGERVSVDYLPYAEDVVVRGKLVAPAHWVVDEQGVRVPTVRAKRIYIASYVQDAGQAQDESAGDESSSPDQGSPAGDGSSSEDPTPQDGEITSRDVRIWIHVYIEILGRA
jgi:hypothetical protein